MQLVYPDVYVHDAARRPTPLDLLAAGLLLATVILHAVAMTPQYLGGLGQGSLWSQPDQAALYSVLAAGWALALGLGLTGPARARISAGLAVGLGVMGLQDVFFALRLPFDSGAARELSARIAEEIYLTALEASAGLAEQHGPHPAFGRTRAAAGKLQPDLWDVPGTQADRWLAPRRR